MPPMASCRTSASGRSRGHQPGIELSRIKTRTRSSSINMNLKRKATPVGALTAGLPVAKLNSFGRVSVGLTTCEYKIYIEVTLEIIVLLYNPLTATGGFTGGQFLITGWDFMRLLLVGLVKRDEAWTKKRSKLQVCN